MSDSSARPSEVTAPRRWWLAVLLFFVSASGYLYVGRPLRYAACLIWFVAVVALLFVLPGNWLSQPAGFLVYCGVALAGTLFIIIDLIRLSRRQPDYKLRWYNRWWVYLGTLLISSALSFLPDVLGGPAAQNVRTFSIPSVSGAPALQVGDYILVDNSAYRQENPSRGDVVVFTLPRDENVTWIKRVIGLPGDRVQMKDGKLFLNETMVTREAAGKYASPDDPAHDRFREHLPGGRSYYTLDRGQSAGDNTPVVTVPAGHYFMLGDNRDNSADSRFPNIGLVPRAHILARATIIIFAGDLKRIGNRIE